MKKYFYLMGLMMGLVVSGLALSACGSDDDGKGGGTNGGGSNGDNSSSSLNRVKKLVEDDNGTHIESVFTYDSEGRIAKVVKTQTSSKNGTRVSETTYQYGELMITSQEVTEGAYNRTESHTYTLTNGLITKDVEVQKFETNPGEKTTMTFSYDKDGYLASQTSDSGDGVKKQDYVWSDGNLISFDAREFQYSNIAWGKGMFLYYNGTNTDRFLQPYGYWGKMPKNLMSKDNFKEATYDYVVTNGQVSKITVTSNRKGEVVYVATLTWE